MRHTRHCLLCGSAEFTLLDRRLDHGEEVTNWLCAHCGLVFMSPQMEEAELSEFYARRYHDLYQGSDAAPQNLGTQRARAAHLAELAASLSPRYAHHLDIGCSAGALIEEMHSATRCTGSGVEPGDGHRAYCESRGLQVFRSLEEAVAASPCRFDLITLSHVLEHVSDPVQFLAGLREDALAPHGRLLIEVPNLYTHPCFEVAHNFSFSEPTLRETLRRAGFRVEVLRKHSVPTPYAVPIYLTVVARADAPSAGRGAPAAKPTAVAWRRRLGRSIVRLDEYRMAVGRIPRRANNKIRRLAAGRPAGRLGA